MTIRRARSRWRLATAALLALVAAVAPIQANAAAQPTHAGNVAAPKASWSSWDVLYRHSPVWNFPGELTISSWGPGNLNVFGVNNVGYHLAWEPYNNGWGPWSVIASGPLLSSAPVKSVSWAPGHIDVFAVTGSDGTTNGTLQHFWYDNGRWLGPETLFPDRRFDYVVGVTSWQPGLLDLFAVDASGALVHSGYSQGSWHGWDAMPGGFPTSPIGWNSTAVSWGFGRIDLAGLDGNGVIRHIGYNGTNGGWLGWDVIPGSEAGGYRGFAMSAGTSGHLDVFANDAHANVLQTTYDVGAGWTGWRGVSTTPYPYAFVSGATSWGPNRIDIVGDVSGDPYVHATYS